MRFLTRIGRVFPRSTRLETVRTTYRIPASPEDVWKAMMFYEEVPGRPPLLLRSFLPAPIRTRGDKTLRGAMIECEYENGYLEKQITDVTPPSFVSFDVQVQKLGIEDAVTMGDGSYTLRPADGGTDVILATQYRGHLRPRWLWRPFERFLSRRMHRFILDGMRVAVSR